MMVASRKVGDAAGQMGAPVLMASSQFQNSGSVSRWGDYSDVEVDPTDDATFWGVVEMNGSNQWTTEIQSWEVTKPVNSVPRLQPLTVSQLIGTHVGGGGVAKLYDADQDTYDVRSERAGRAGQIAGVITTYNTVLPGADITQFIVDFSATMAFGRRVSATVFLWDYDAGEWVFGKAFNVRRNLISDYTYEVTSNIDRFVSDTGDIKVLVRSHEAQSRWFGGPRAHYIQLDKVLVGVVD
jgi:hypothetical protein